MRATRRAYAPHPPDSDQALVERHAGLISRMARKVAQRMGCPGSEEELWSAGALGLLEAHRRFDPSRQLRFETFAEHRVRGAMLDELRRSDHLPRRLRAQLDALRKAKQVEAQRRGREPSQEELAAALECNLEELAAREALLLPPLQIGELELAASSIPLPHEILEHAEERARLADAVRALPERLQLLLSLHYVEELPYKEIAHLLKVSEPRICQLHAQALALIREFLHSETSREEPSP